jgi:hypothetical protein
MPRPVDVGLVHGQFRERIDELLDWERSVDAMSGAGNPRRKGWARQRLCEAILVLAYSHWERFVERLFCAHLSQEISQLGRHFGLSIEGRVTGPMAEALIAGERYFDFKSYGDLKDRAKKLLVRHRFAKAKDADRKAIDEMIALRNQILHRSRHSLRQLKAHVERRIDPGTHLAAKKGGITRLRIYLLAFKSISKAIRTRNRRS